MKIVSFKHNQSGQAVLEYVLVLLVVVSICLGMMWQYSDAFRKFTNAYFGEYLACLLELGELPALGGPTSGECAAEFESFSIANGVPRSGQGYGSGDSSDDSSKSDEEKSEESRGGSSGGSAGAYAKAAESTARSTESSRTLGRSSTNSSSGRPVSVVIGTVADDPYTGSTEDSNRVTRVTASRAAGTVTLVDQSGGIIDPFENRKVKEAPIGVAKDSSAEGLKPKTAKVEINRKTASADRTDEDSGMGFGDFLRWLLIAAIIIAIVFFLGGQALQISKSGE